MQFGTSGGFTAINNAGDQDGSWKTLEVLGLTEADFGGGQGFFSTPNTLRIGFGFTSSAELGPFDPDPITYEIEVQSFQVTVIPIPEPSASLLFISAGALLLGFRRNK